jgi:hypothetical protein
VPDVGHATTVPRLWPEVDADPKDHRLSARRSRSSAPISPTSPKVLRLSRTLVRFAARRA